MEELRDTNFCIISSLLPKIFANRFERRFILYRCKMEDLKNINFPFFLSSKNLIDSNENLYAILYRHEMEELRDTNFRLISSLHPKIVANLIYLNKNLYIYEIK